MQLEEQLEALGPPPDAERPMQPAPTSPRTPVWVDWLGKTTGSRRTPNGGGWRMGTAKSFALSSLSWSVGLFWMKSLGGCRLIFPELFGQARSRPQQVLTGGRGSAAPSGLQVLRRPPAAQGSFWTSSFAWGSGKSKEDYVKTISE